MVFPLYSPKPDRIHRANWLNRYMDIEQATERSISVALSDAMTDIDARLQGIDSDNLSSNVRRIQYNLALRAIRRILGELFGETANIIRDDRKHAAVAAVEAGVYDDRDILRAIFPDDGDRERYIASLKATAERNVQNTIIRIIKTERPLSKRVYKSQAFANGLVYRKINNGLARGSSAANIAKDVRDLINPNTKGGVAYAAKRLGRTELNNAFHAQSLAQNQDKPWVDHVNWYLSKSHKYEGKPCLCETYARQKRFDKWNVPLKPHPQCYCYTAPVVVDEISFMQNLQIGMYDSYLDTRRTPSAP